MRKPIIAAVLGLAALTGLAQAQDFPARPVTMVVPFAAGGPQDQIGRVVALRMGEILGQQVVVENVGGAGGMTGSARVKEAPPDGYSMILASVGTHAQNQTLFKKPLYDAATDFTPVALLVETPIALITRSDLPVTNMKEFTAYVKANQAKMQYGSAGTGSATHLGCLVLNHALGVRVQHVPYRGTAPAMADLIAGRIDYLCDIINTAKPQIDGGKVKGIAIMTKERSPALPNLPTTAEQGSPGIEAYTWSALFLPKGAPDNVVKKLNDAAVQTLNTPAVKEALGNVGAEVVPNNRASAAYLGQFVKDEIAKWAVPIKASGASAD
jgi:tripartite-type tricarboxylate transporter receptor subunit TctC